MAIKDCEQCGHETDEELATCSFCGAPRIQKKTMLAWPPVEPAKWAAVILILYGLFHISFIYSG